MRTKKLLSLIVAAIWLAGLAGCAGAPPPLPAEPPPPAPLREETSDQARLKEALTGREMPPGELGELCDRLLANNNWVNDQETMARLELALLKALKGPDQGNRQVLWRNLGIIHFHQRKYKAAQHDLQSANELNPRNARTHYYLARLSVQQGEIYERQGKKSKARQQFKRAAIEMELARKFEPSNPLYRQNIKQMTGQE